MQVLIEEDEYERFQQAAGDKGLTLAEWVRQVLRRAAREQPGRSADRKLAAIRLAARHGFPTGDVEQVLDEVRRGFAGPLPE